MKKKQNIFHILYLLLISARPRQLTKNLVLFAPLLFSGFLFYNPVDNLPYFIIVALAFIVFSITTSSIYLINDIIDRELDQKHPTKQNRPIASGELLIPSALFAAVSGLVISLFLSFFFSFFFQLLIVAYIIMQLLYSFKLKHLPIFDVMIIAAGFLVRIYSGAVVVNLHTSVWFLLTVLSASLFLAVGKRQSEKMLIKNKNITPTRKTLAMYNQRLLDVYISMFANATWLTYALFTFQAEPTAIHPIFEKFSQINLILPRTLHSKKLLMLTLPIVIFGIMRYLALIYEENQGESPEKTLIKDKTLLTTVAVYIVSTVIIIYFT